MTTFHADAPHKPFPDVDSLDAWQARQGSRQVQASTAPASPPSAGKSRLDAALEADAAYIASLTKAGPPPGTSVRRDGAAHGALSGPAAGRGGPPIGAGAGPRGEQGRGLEAESVGIPSDLKTAAGTRLAAALAKQAEDLAKAQQSGPPRGSWTRNGRVE